MNDQSPGNRRPLIREAYPERHPAPGPAAHFEAPEPGADNHLEIPGARNACFSCAVLLRPSIACYEIVQRNYANRDGKNDDSSRAPWA